MIDALDGEQATPAKRRKVRKGTQSCWECKRRKIRCIFASPEDVTCSNCQRRRAPCLSQEMPEDFSTARTGNRQLGERIARVEDFMKNFLASKDNGATSQMERELQHDRHSKSDLPRARSYDSAPSSFLAPLTPAEVREPPIVLLNVLPYCRLESYKIRSRFFTPHTRPARCITPNRDRNSPSSFTCSLSS